MISPEFIEFAKLAGLVLAVAIPIIVVWIIATITHGNSIDEG